jgi:hypothetical protein
LDQFSHSILKKAWYNEFAFPFSFAYSESMQSNRFFWLALIVSLIVFVLACQTAQTISNLLPQPSARTSARRTATREPTEVALEQQAQEPTAIIAITDVPPPTEIPTPIPQPTQPPPPTNRPAAPQPTQPPADTPIPVPTTPSYTYKIQESRCGPNVRTYIEGFVYEGSIGKNDVLVRISQGPDGGPDPNDDYRTGSDPRRKGYYYQNVDSNAPHGGTWYLWVIDPTTQQRISEIAIVKTDPERVEDSGTSAGSCQSATVNFSTGGPGSGPRPTNTPRPTTGGNNNNATPTNTRDLGDDS